MKTQTGPRINNYYILTGLIFKAITVSKAKHISALVTPTKLVETVKFLKSYALKT
jgi:hypothetical protein